MGNANRFFLLKYYSNRMADFHLWEINVVMIVSVSLFFSLSVVLLTYNISFYFTRKSIEKIVYLYSDHNGRDLSDTFTKIESLEILEEVEPKFSDISEKIQSEFDMYKLGNQQVDKKKLDGFLKDDPSILNKLLLLGIHSMNKTSVVLLALDKLTQKRLLLKVQKKNQANIASIKREISVLRVAKHPNIIKLHGACETQIFFWIVLQYCGPKNLTESFLITPIENKQKQKIASQLISAIDYLHNKGIMHRAITNDNVYLDDNKNAILFDFSSAVFQNTSDEEVGSLFYMAPEMIDPKITEYTMVIDWWALGVVLFKMDFKFYPFDKHNFFGEVDEKEVKKKILNEQPKRPDKSDEKFLNMLEKFFVKNPTKRLGYEDRLDEFKKLEYFQGFDWGKFIF